jgi:hypothetical protein
MDAVTRTTITGQETTAGLSLRLIALAFVAGFLAVPLFHQPMLVLLHAIGLTPATPYAMRPLPPLGLPQVVSQSFWGGVWGIVFALVAPRFPRGALYWVAAVLFGAFALSLVAWFIVAPLKGLPTAGGGRPSAIATGLLVNGAWGCGTALLLMAFRAHAAIVAASLEEGVTRPRMPAGRTGLLGPPATSDGCRRCVGFPAGDAGADHCQEATHVRAVPPRRSR